MKKLIPLSTPHVIGVDTGLSNGLACIRGNNLVAVWQGPPDQVRDQLTIMILSCLDGGGSLDIGLLPLIAAERFTNRPTQGQPRTTQGDAERVLGVVKDVAERHSCKLVLQQPSSVKKFAPNSLLYRLGMHVKGSDIGQADANDINDAIRHALTATATSYAVVFDDMLKAIGF